jgi:hypothetical protein
MASLRRLIPPLFVLATCAVTFACSSSGTSGVASSSPATPDSSTDDDASSQPTSADQDGASPDSGAADSGRTPELVVLSNSQSPDESCDTFCASLKTTCTPSCKLPSGKTGAAYITDVIDLDGHTKTTEYASCSDKVVSAPASVGGRSKCCCLSAPAQTVTQDLSGTASCDAQCKSAGFTCDSGGYVTFTRADGTTCGRTVVCADQVSPTSACNQKASASASLACTCR